MLYVCAYHISQISLLLPLGAVLSRILLWAVLMNKLLIWQFQSEDSLSRIQKARFFWVIYRYCARYCAISWILRKVYLVYWAKILISLFHLQLSLQTKCSDGENFHFIFKYLINSLNPWHSFFPQNMILSKFTFDLYKLYSSKMFMNLIYESSYFLLDFFSFHI